MEVKAPGIYVPMHGKTIFLAGSIEMGSAIDWQTELVSKFDVSEVLFLNPRRDAWDSSWEQSISNPDFKQQVTWELRGIEYADLVVFVFDPNTKSPVTLLELGLATGLGRSVVIYCPKPFWRKGNVDIVAARYGLPMVNDLKELIDYISNFLY
jgi:nucleoside 2-deoxyribosyltransferase